VATLSTLTPEPIKDESKDFVEHLRTVHFALLAVCLGLVVIVTGSSETTKAAKLELDEVSDVSAAFSDDWLKAEAREFLASASDCQAFAHQFLPQDTVTQSTPTDLLNTTLGVVFVPYDAKGNLMDDASWLSMIPRTLKSPQPSPVSRISGMRSLISFVHLASRIKD
jgi:hypothetical protein